MDLQIFKRKVLKSASAKLNEKIDYFEAALLDLTQGAQNDSKSSAGDKHETARAMMQIEHEKIAKQLQETLQQKEELEKINPEVSSKKIGKGSLVKTTNGFLFLSIGLGKIVVDKIPVVALSAQSPLGIKLIGLAQGDSTVMNDVKYLIVELG